MKMYWKGIYNIVDIFVDHQAHLNDARVPHWTPYNNVNFANGPRRCV